MNIVIDLFFFAAFFAMGCAWQYTNLRSKYHRGCGNFFGECAELIIADRFDPGTVVLAFRANMPWQDDVDPDVLKRMR